MIPAVLIAVWAAAVALAPSPTVSVALFAPLVLVPAALWIMARQSNWIANRRKDLLNGFRNLARCIKCCHIV